MVQIPPVQLHNIYVSASPRISSVLLHHIHDLMMLRHHRQEATFARQMSLTLQQHHLMRHLTTPAPYPPFPPFPLSCGRFDIAHYEPKELREDISVQVVCHASVTFTGHNNSRLPLAPMSASSLCLSHAFVCGQ